jgi:anti-anti-sigma factor
MDSSGLGLILGRCERASEIGCSVRIQGLSDSLVRLVKLCGLERIRNLVLIS